ncbi:MAG: penicillin-binding protein 1C [Rhodoferax sp.]|nr:penicillin-binding protein 1C [Rhodoferax sp.]MDP3652988.1 penicillin-binding protein 1C [Rhodoferax sp.]
MRGLPQDVDAWATAQLLRLPRFGRRARLGLLCTLALLVVLALPRWLPKPPLSSLAPSSRSITAAGGELLRLTLASDEQYRLWTALDDIAPPMREAVLLYEDRWFYWHIGVNPWALVRAAGATAVGQRRMGGSTITMQLARRAYGIDSRDFKGKLRQVAAALWLEWRYSKRDILEAYLNVAPFGGNIEGVGAASLVYLRKPARLLTAAEALNLAVIPQNPRKRLGEIAGAAASAELRAARQRLVQRWVAKFPADARLLEANALQTPFKTRASLPFHAPHLVDALLRQSGERDLVASVDLPTQKVLERVLGEYVKSRVDVGINNACALLVDTSTMQVKALVGSADYHNETIAGQVNCALGRRSPGSTLKPFIYGLALDQGLIHSASILKDAPSSYGGFSPENFDGRFAGPLPAQEALIRSRNLPAVDLAARLTRPNLYDFLKLGGVQKLASESHYGLALALGGGELTPEELVQFYAMLANQGQWQELQYLAHTRQAKPAQPPLTLLSAAASHITLDMLRQTPRPDTFAPARPAVAWKTGTSWGFRDAWTAGVFGRYAMVVWVGNFDGSSNPELIGIEAAAPLFLRIVDALRAERLAPAEMAFSQPADLQRIEVCAASGELPNDACKVRHTAWFIAGKSPIRQSTLHRTVLVDTRSGKLACAPGPHTREETFEYWPSDMLALFKRAGMPLRLPPEGACAQAAMADGAPHIVLPLRGVTHMQRLNQPQPIQLRAEAGSGTVLHWFAQDTLLGQSRPGETLAWTPPQAGRYTLRVVDADGRSETRELAVGLVQ